MTPAELALEATVRDLHAYRGALGYAVPGWHDGKLSDGTTPRCGICDARARNASLQARREGEPQELSAPMAAGLLVTLKAECETQRAAKDAAYEERNSLVAVLSKLWPSHRAQHPDDPSWDAEWRTIICIHSPVGQLTWHIHDSHRQLFAHLLDGESHWDGHSTAEKYQRLADLSAPPAVRAQETP
jgi:hypothetical protein